MAAGNKARAREIAKKKLALRNALWPDLSEDSLWNRQKTDGWLSVPRAMPLLLQIIDRLSKGKPVSSTYLDLWFRTYDQSFVTVNKSREMAFFSGFTGERAERTWMNRVNILSDLGFIDVKEGANGPVSFVVILNPYHVVKRHHGEGQVDERSFNALKQRMNEIGAHDLDEKEKSASSKENFSDAEKAVKKRIYFKKSA